MDERKPNDDLLARLQFIDAMARQRLPGAEFAILVLVTLGQRVSARELGLTRQGFKRALDALIARTFISWEGQRARLHPEACAKFGIVVPEQGDTGNALLRTLIDGRLERRPVKNLYRLNAEGMPASEEELDMLRAQLLDAAIFITARLTREGEDEVRRKYGQQKMSREAEMRALASVLVGFVEGRLANGIPGGLGRAVSEANRSVKAMYPRVLDPHWLLDRFKSALREIDDKRIALQLKLEGQARRRAQSSDLPEVQGGKTPEAPSITSGPAPVPGTASTGAPRVSPSEVPLSSPEAPLSSAEAPLSSPTP